MTMRGPVSCMVAVYVLDGGQSSFITERGWVFLWFYGHFPFLLAKSNNNKKRQYEGGGGLKVDVIIRFVKVNLDSVLFLDRPCELQFLSILMGKKSVGSTALQCCWFRFQAVGSVPSLSPLI